MWTLINLIWTLPSLFVIHSKKKKGRERDTSVLGLLWETDLHDDADEVHFLIYGSNGVLYFKELVVIAIPHISLKTLFLSRVFALKFIV
jgi:hypothetical protein